WLQTIDPDRLDRIFLRLWTRKEAVIKYYGATVAHDMARFSVPLAEGIGSWPLYPNLSESQTPLQLRDLDTGYNILCSICTDKSVENTRFYVLGEYELSRILKTAGTKK
ncbi:MAG: 4-phosphopantetheinyl transferase family protein, partial [Spirochaetales bacterium]|nr:4-phosphopantetheinyl transferase family protein [Spirochaetales bacterium]